MICNTNWLQAVANAITGNKTNYFVEDFNRVPNRNWKCLLKHKTLFEHGFHFNCNVPARYYFSNGTKESECKHACLLGEN